MRASLWPPTLAAIPLAFGIAWLAHWLLLLIGCLPDFLGASGAEPVGIGFVRVSR